MNDPVAYLSRREAHAPEWAGAPLGISNIMTRTLGTAVRRQPRDRDRLLLHARRALEGKDAFIQDAVLHGLRLRLFSTSHHLADFWCDAFYTLQEWRCAAARIPGPEPDAVLYAIKTSPEEEGVTEFPEEGEAYLFQTSRFEDLRESALSLVRHRLRPKGILALPAAAADLDGKGLLCLGDPEPEARTAALALVALGARLIDADNAFLRFACRTKKGEWVVPVSPLQDPIVAVRRLDDTPFEIRSLDLDESEWRVFAYRGSKGLYLPTEAISSAPSLARGLLRAKFENVPGLTESSLEGSHSRTEPIEAALLSSSEKEVASIFSSFPAKERRSFLARLIESEGSRAMASPEALLGKNRAAGPLEPVAIHAIVLLRSNAREETVLRPLPPDELARWFRRRHVDDSLGSRLSRISPAYEVNPALLRDPSLSPSYRAVERAARLLVSLVQKGPERPLLTRRDFLEGDALP